MNNFITLRDISLTNLRKILSDAKKRKKKRNILNTLDLDKDKPLKGKLLVQMYEKSSLRTRLSFYLAIRQLGGSAITLRPEEIHLNKNGESISDTAMILSTYADLFMLRTDSDNKINEFAKYSKIPLINGLTPKSHPTQILSDIFTIEEIKKRNISNLNISWIGDSNNVLNSLIEASVKFSFNLTIGCPKVYEPSKKIINWANKKKGKIIIYNDPKKAVKNADVILTDKVISMNDKGNIIKKKNFFKNFRVDKKLISGAKKNVIILHCLPRGNEISDIVFKSKSSYVWQQASNRIHVQKSILLYCLNKLR
tara:strand:- start:565 stop:1494 length:930 start_codon:yes stop_codon:yes gene_type:complete